MKLHHKSLIFITLIISVSMILGVWYESNRAKERANAPLQLQTGTAFPEPRALPEFELVNFNGRKYTEKSFKGYWSFVFFGYTYCPQICPMVLESMHNVSQAIGKGQFTRFVLVSIDPEHDTPERMKTYFSQKKFEGTPFIGLTGDAKEIQKLALSLGLFVDGEEDSESGHIEHSGSMLLINPEGELAAVFSSQNNPSLIARDYRQLMRTFG